MLSNDEIKARYFEFGNPIDRHGNYMTILAKDDETKQGYCTLLHYHLLNGVSDKAAVKKLREYDLSEPEAQFTLRKAKEFIETVLELPLDEIRKGLTSTVNYLYQEIQPIYTRIAERYETQRHENIEFQGILLQADEKSRASLASYVQSDTSPGYWLDAQNNRLGSEEHPFDVAACKAVLAAIVERDAQLHAAMTELKRTIRTLAEAQDFTGIKSVATEEGLL
ncbi:hypothetical protein G173_gp081 [Erwinia phage phiEaH2]|uniref:DUF4376 domain-containing protein n=1 Tax=Erwinia phage phiEaH2 TaxID=1029988 RepID=J7KC91_9CAUD|nr:hypothetical protein G173_gp081 [Erwinia phage phiEaH2]AFQ96626.1 hypothetical protein [Erwinia phage phiEaH2]